MLAVVGCVFFNVSILFQSEAQNLQKYTVDKKT